MDAEVARELHEMKVRLTTVERRVGLRGEAAEPVAFTAPVRPAPEPALAPVLPPRVPARPAPPWASWPSLEELLGGRVLAWTGGLAVCIGLAFLFAVAISRGWIGEGARVVLGGAFSLALLAAGARLHERRTSDSALAGLVAAGTGLAGLFAAITVGTAGYAVLPAVLGLVAAGVVGALAVFLAVRWSAVPIAILGMVGAVASPLLVQAPADAVTLVFLWIATAASTAVLVARRWDRIGLAIALLALAQWAGWLLDRPHAVITDLVVLLAFGSLGALAAVGYDVRTTARRLRALPAFGLALNAFALGLVGWNVLHGTLGGAATMWLIGLAALHLAGGLAARHTVRVSNELRLLALALGVGLADTAFGLLGSGPALAIGWTLAGVVCARVATRQGLRPGERELATLGLGLHVAFALVRALIDAPPSTLAAGGDAGGLLAVAVLAAGCLTSGRLAGSGRAEIRAALDALGLVAVAYLTALAVSGPALVAAWALEAVALAGMARALRDDVARNGALGFLLLAAAHAVGVEAPLSALARGVSDEGAAAVALGAVAVAAVLCAGRQVDPRVSTVLRAVGVLLGVHLASVLIVTGFGSGQTLTAPGLLELGARQQGQVALSVFWALGGLAALLLGLRRPDGRALRLAGLAGLGVAATKVFLFDLATLTSVYRVASFIALGLLLLLGGVAWERARPGPRGKEAAGAC